MNRKIIALILICLIGLSLVTTFYGFSQEDNEAKEIKQILKDQIKGIEKWENKANILIFLTVMVGLLGVITGILQRYDKKWCKVATVIAGALISIITVINNTVFEVDYRTLKSKSTEGRKLVHDIRLKLLQGYNKDSEEDRKVWFNEIAEKLHQFYKLEKEIYTADISINLVSNAYAQPLKQIKQQPTWISKPPIDRINLYFIGIGDSPSLKSAKEYSYQHAVEGAVEYLVSALGTEQQSESGWLDIERLSEYLIESAEVADTYFNYNRNENLYHYYTLLKLNKRFAEADIKLFAMQEKIKIPENISQNFEYFHEPSENYYKNRVFVYETLLSSAKKSLSSQQYSKFIEGRELRKKGDFKKAIELLEEVTQENPTFYFGWYNLALAYDALEDFHKANQAYEKAEELEPMQPTRDASFYNTYGYFLYRHKNYEEAIVHLKKALEINPDHPKAKRTLQAVEKTMK